MENHTHCFPRTAPNAARILKERLATKSPLIRTPHGLTEMDALMRPRLWTAVNRPPATYAHRGVGARLFVLGKSRSIERAMKAVLTPKKRPI